MQLFVGVMSGTSMDGIDVALASFDDGRAAMLAASSQPWPPALVDELRHLASGRAVPAVRLAELDVLLGEQFAAAVLGLLQDNGIDPAAVSAIGCHGQTVAHSPARHPPATLQLGDANVIAERTAITTVNDFRRRDLACGGQGAPLAPAFHEAFMRSPAEDRVVLNLGGIANITVLPADSGDATRGFDTGPANCLIDLWYRRHHRGDYDADGAWAATAAPDPDLLAALLDDPYFSLAHPKSTGTQYFSSDWLDSRLSHYRDLAPAVVQSTLAALTVESVSTAVRGAAPHTRRVLVCGGGAHNSHLLRGLSARLGLPVESTALHGIAPDWIEALAFAWLARQTLAGRPGNLTGVTGAAARRILGAIHPA